MIKAIIIDNEKHCLITLEHFLKLTGEVEILSCIQKSTEAESAIRRLRPDLVFIDIEMPELNGFEVLNNFETLFFKVVFTTAYDQYAIRALKMNALDYLQKPVSLEDVKNVLEKFKSNQIESGKYQISNVYKFSGDKLQDTIALSVSEGLIFVKLDDIVYIEADGSYCNIIMSDNRKHLVSKSMVVFEEVLGDYSLFFRVHKSFIVNLKFIKRYIRGEGGEIIMSDNRNIALSRSKKQEFLNLFQKI
jgi:two-component system LytT family response regulator